MANTGLQLAILKIRDRLVLDKIVEHGERVKLLARSMKIPHLNGDRDILLRLKGLASPQDVVQGAGRMAKAYRNLDVILRNRDSRDSLGIDEQWLLEEQGKGFLDLEHLVFDSLEMFQPEDDAGTVLLAEGMRLLNSTEPDREMQTKGMVQGWGSSVMTFQLCYEIPLLHTDRQ